VGGLPSRDRRTRRHDRRWPRRLRLSRAARRPARTSGANAPVPWPTARFPADASGAPRGGASAMLPRPRGEPTGHGRRAVEQRSVGKEATR
jgi:hypothetical protein